MNLMMLVENGVTTVGKILKDLEQDTEYIERNRESNNEDKVK